MKSSLTTLVKYTKQLLAMALLTASFSVMAEQAAVDAVSEAATDASAEVAAAEGAVESATEEVIEEGKEMLDEEGVDTEAVEAAASSLAE